MCQNMAIFYLKSANGKILIVKSDHWRAAKKINTESNINNDKNYLRYNYIGVKEIYILY